MKKIAIALIISLSLIGCGVGTAIKQANSPDCQKIGGVNEETLKEQGFKLKSFNFNAKDRTTEKTYEKNFTTIIVVERDGKIENITCKK